MSNAYIIQKQAAIGLLERPMDDLYFGNISLGVYRRQALRRSGIKSIQHADLNETISGPALIISDDVFISQRALRAFLRTTKRKKPTKTCILVMPTSRLTTLFAPLQDVPVTQEGLVYDVFYVPPGMTGTLHELTQIQDCEKTVIPYREILLSQRIPQFILGATQPYMEVPLTSTVVMRVRHWLHVVRLAHLWPQICLIEKAQHSWWHTLWHLLMGFSLSPRRRLANYYDRFCYIDNGVFIHPTATVEASVVGKNVHIGAYANVVGSVLGDGTVIEERANVNYSVFGPNTFVSKNSTIVASVAFGPTDVCTNGIQYALIDEGCALTSWAQPLDASPYGPVRVKDGDALREVGELPCGVAFGKKTYVGAGVMIAPGRAIPAGQTLTRDREDLILS